MMHNNKTYIRTPLIRRLIFGFNYSISYVKYNFVLPSKFVLVLSRSNLYYDNDNDESYYIYYIHTHNNNNIMAAVSLAPL